jgi:enamine deaminase RidA (YjgF/YER057c/UK114 family)
MQETCIFVILRLLHRNTILRRDLEAVRRAQSKCFTNNRPATSVVEVPSLIDPEMLVEIEAEAIVGE